MVDTTAILVGEVFDQYPDRNGMVLEPETFSTIFNAIFNDSKGLPMAYGKQFTVFCLDFRASFTRKDVGKMRYDSLAKQLLERGLVEEGRRT